MGGMDGWETADASECHANGEKGKGMENDQLVERRQEEFKTAGKIRILVDGDAPTPKEKHITNGQHPEGEAFEDACKIYLYGNF